MKLMLKRIDNFIGAEGTEALCKVLEKNMALTELNLSRKEKATPSETKKWVKCEDYNDRE